MSRVWICKLMRSHECRADTANLLKSLQARTNVLIAPSSKTLRMLSVCLHTHSTVTLDFPRLGNDLVRIFGQNLRIALSNISFALIILGNLFHFVMLVHDILSEIYKMYTLMGNLMEQSIHLNSLHLFPLFWGRHRNKRPQQIVIAGGQNPTNNRSPDLI